MMTTTDVISAFLHKILPPATIKDDAYLIVEIFTAPYDDNGKYRHRNPPRRETFLWPAEVADAVACIQREAESHDVYICPYLHKDGRSRGGAAWRQLVHCDVDENFSADKARALGGFIVWSGSPGHGHVYIPLAHAVTRDQHEALLAALRDHLGGDAKIRDNDLLRPPGTYNYKPTVMNGGGQPRVLVVAEEP